MAHSGFRSPLGGKVGWGGQADSAVGRAEPEPEPRGFLIVGAPGRGRGRQRLDSEQFSAGL